MANIQSQPGKPLPYTFKSLPMESGQFLQHAIIECRICHGSAQFPWVHKENPHLIAEKFARLGWAIYKGGQVRCPECKRDRLRQQAAFAKRSEQMNTPPSGLVKTSTNGATPIEQRRPRSYIVTIDGDGTPTIRETGDSLEMILGDKAYICFPVEP